MLAVALSDVGPIDGEARDLKTRYGRHPVTAEPLASSAFQGFIMDGGQDAMMQLKVAANAPRTAEEPKAKLRPMENRYQ